MDRVVTWTLRLAFFARLFAGISDRGQLKKHKPLLTFMAWAYVIKQRRLTPLLVACASLIRFRLGSNPDSDRISLFEHVVRFLATGKVGLKLAPMLPGDLRRSQVLNGPWRRHRTEFEVGRRNLGIYRTFFIGDSITRPLKNVCIIANPADAEQVLTDKETFPTRGHTGIEDFIEGGLLGLPSGEKHSAHRRLVMKFLSDKYLQEFSGVIGQEIEVMLNKWKQNGNGVNAQYDLALLTLDVIMRTAFGVEGEWLSQHIPEEENWKSHALDKAMKEAVLGTGLPFWKYISPNRFEVADFTQKYRALEAKLIEESVAKYESEGENHAPTMISELLRARQANEDDAKGLTIAEIGDELQTVRAAGHETTSNTLSWAMYLLAKHPEKMAKLKEEANQVVKGDVCTFEESKQARYHLQVVYETLRLYPTVTAYPRAVAKDTTLKGSGYDLPEGSLVMVSQASLSRNPECFDRADEFIPERFEQVSDLLMGKPVGVPNGPKFGYAPFGAGNRSCVGQRLAILEAVQILSTLTKRVDWSLVNPDAEIEEVNDITLGPKNPKKGLILNVHVA